MIHPSFSPVEPPSFAPLVTEGATLYRREIMLPRLLPVSPEDLAPDDAGVARRICGLLARALRHERARGRAGHWSYDLDRHIGLAQAFRAERRRLAGLTQPGKEEGRGHGPRPGRDDRRV